MGQANNVAGRAGAPSTPTGVAALLGGGAECRPLCVNNCGEKALAGSCPKHGGPKLACSDECYAAWKARGGRHVAGKVVRGVVSKNVQQDRQEFVVGGELRAIREPSDTQRFQASLAARQQAREQASTFGVMTAGLTWSRSWTPTLSSLLDVRELVPRAYRTAVTEPPKPKTEFEKADGRPMVFSSEAGANPFCTSLEAKAAWFDEQILPSTQKPDTRHGYYSAWCSFVTFMLIHGAVEAAMPATDVAIKAFAVQLVMVGYTGATLVRFFEAIIDRHRQYDIPLGVSIEKMHKWLAAIQKGLGLPKRDKFFVLPVHIRCVMQLPRDTLRRTRDAAILVVGTVCALRSGEVSRLDVCDLLWDIDGIGTLALLLWCRKNDGLK